MKPLSSDMAAFKKDAAVATCVRFLRFPMNGREAAQCRLTLELNLIYAESFTV
jgi:hypothetical protein